MNENTPHDIPLNLVAFQRAARLSGIPEDKVKWHVRWIRRFSAFLKEKPLHAAERHDAESFIATLATSAQNEPWQIRQATDSVKLLLTAVLGKPWIDPQDVPRGHSLDDKLDLFGHSDVSTTMIYTHLLNRPGLSVKSPADE